MATGVLFGKSTAPAEMTREQENEQPLLRAARSNRTRPSGTPRERHSSDARAQGSRVAQTVTAAQSSTQAEPVQENQSGIQTEQQRLAAFNMEAFNPQQQELIQRSMNIGQISSANQNYNRQTNSEASDLRNQGAGPEAATG